MRIIPEVARTKGTGHPLKKGMEPVCDAVSRAARALRCPRQQTVRLIVRRYLFFTLIGAVVFSSDGFAGVAGARLVEVSGRVMLDNGEGYRLVASGTAVAEGDRVVVLDQARARLIDEGGCLTDLKANSIFIVDLAVPCEQRSARIRGPFLVQAIGADEGGLPASQSDVGHPGVGAIGLDLELPDAAETPFPAPPVLGADTVIQIETDSKTAGTPHDVPGPGQDDDRDTTPAVVAGPGTSSPPPRATAAWEGLSAPHGEDSRFLGFNLGTVAAVGGGVALALAGAGGGGGGGGNGDGSPSPFDVENGPGQGIPTPPQNLSPQ